MCHASEEVAMKKVFIIVFLVITASLLFAAEGDGVYTGVTDKPFRPVSLDREGDLNYSLFGNAAGLAAGGFRIQVPYSVLLVVHFPHSSSQLQLLTSGWVAKSRRQTKNWLLNQ